MRCLYIFKYTCYVYDTYARVKRVEYLRWYDHNHYAHNAKLGQRKSSAPLKVHYAPRNINNIRMFHYCQFYMHIYVFSAKNTNGVCCPFTVYLKQCMSHTQHIQYHNRVSI
uniref:Uncharacterized protein n=1 Tax=Sipha flava TaxID=143950 RepID=A0A2S2QXV9_9HEMI